MAVNLFGWDLVFRSVKNELEKKEDFLVAFTHWFLIKNGFLCVDIENSKTLTGDEVKSETLPEGWNKQGDYNIRYIEDNRLYQFRASVTGSDIIFNFLRVDDLRISSCIFGIDSTVKEITENLTTAMPNHKNILMTLRTELLEPVFAKSTTSVAGTQTPESRNDPAPHTIIDPSRDPLRVPSRLPQRPPLIDQMWDPTSVGRSDLDPFGRGGSGMIFDPLGPRGGRRDPTFPGPSFPGGLPRGAVPPGARFDPFAPPGTGRDGRSDPDPDHLPPPGYDMFG